MTEPLSVDLLLALDDGSARETAYQVLADQALSAPSLKPIFSSRCPADLPPTDAEWVDSVATAVLQHWLLSSGLGWLPDDPGIAPAATLDALLHPDEPRHRAVADALYHWALPSHCHHGGTVLMAFMTDPAVSWGDRLADWATSPDRADRLAPASAAERAEELALIIGKLRWLAPHRVAEVARAHADIALSPETSFRFQSAGVLGVLAPRIGEAVNLCLVRGSLTQLCGFTLASSLSGESALVEPEEPLTHLTETVLRERFEELSPAERQMLGEALVRALPLLRKAIGEFVEPTIRRLAAANS
jgi:hypothetical protein